MCHSMYGLHKYKITIFLSPLTDVHLGEMKIYQLHKIANWN